MLSGVDRRISGRASPDAAARHRRSPPTPAAVAGRDAATPRRLGDRRRAQSRAARPGEDPRIGTTLGGRYYVRRLCGEGAMGRVYEAHHIDIGRRVAIKVLHASFHTSADLVERFRREARAASKIGHANIVDVTDSGTTPDGAFYFVMEFLDGTNLEELIDARRAAARRARAADHRADHARAARRRTRPTSSTATSSPPTSCSSTARTRTTSSRCWTSASRRTSIWRSGERGAALTRPDVAIGTPVYMSPEQAAGQAGRRAHRRLRHRAACSTRC